ncbi:MAG: alpha/beta fold hydrolase [Planctomycetes bacterium]|nr:alpha/beta fold hydrolase [Planctomycetota bacterium]
MQPTPLACRDVGNGPVVLLVHGFPFHGGQWDAVVPMLARHARVIVPDLRGFGESTFSENTFGERGEGVTHSMDAHADDLAATLEGLGVREAVALVGFSMGGYASFSFWRRHRERVRALALCNTRAIADTPEVAAGRATMAARVLREGATPVVESMLPRLLAPDTLATRPDVVRSVRALMDVAPPLGIAASLRGMAARVDSTPLLGHIDVPTLVVVGEHDAISSPTEMRGIAAAIPRSRTVALARCGHMSTHESPEQLARALEEWMSKS